jgi:ketosteroid isomerase-like protein
MSYWFIETVNSGKMKMKIILLAFILAAVNGRAQDEKVEIEQMLSQFVHNLNHLDLEPFMENFDADATIFYPRASFPIGRVSGREAIQKEFLTFFDNVRSSRTGPPYLNIVPKDREIELHDSLAVVTLHFEMGEEFHRRTLILEKQGGRWLINHLHASFLTGR